VWDPANVRQGLKHLARTDWRRRALGARQHRYRLGSPLPEQAVVEFERRHGVVLPHSYRQLLLLVGDGGAGPGYGLYPLDGPDMHDLRYDWWQVPGLLQTPFPHRRGWNHHLDEDSYDYDDPRLAAGALPITTLGCTMDVLLIVTGPSPGEIWIDDRGADGGIQPTCDDFATWYLNWLGTDPAPAL
jgi:hypothetical protein